MKTVLFLTIIALASATQYYYGTVCSIQYTGGHFSFQACYDTNQYGCVIGGKFNNADVCVVSYGNYGITSPGLQYRPGNRTFAGITTLFNQVNATYWHAAAGAYYICGTPTSIDFGFIYKGMRP